MNKTLLLFVLIASFSVQAQRPIQEFNFDGNLCNAQNTTCFTGKENYVSDRRGLNNSAIRLTKTSLQATIDNLPQDNSPRTISVWVKFNTIASANNIWGYGTTTNAQFCGLQQQATVGANSNVNFAGWGASNDVIASTPILKNKWYQYTVTFDGVTSQVFRNGKLIKSLEGTTKATKGSIFKIGEINKLVGIDADIDDLKIYGVAMSAQKIEQLYDLSNYDTNDNTVAPAPVYASVKKAVSTPISTKIEVAQNTTTKAVKNTVGKSKSVEVFSQGEKVLNKKSNDLNLSELPDGTYLLKISNNPNTNKVSFN